MSAPRCGLTVHGVRCPNSVVGRWMTLDGPIPLCEPCRASVAPEAYDWEPDPTQVAINDRLERMAQRYFG